MQKTATYQSTNTYDTLNNLTSNTKNVWLVLHGIGYLSRYFINYFTSLNAEENYIICPQAPSKYYKDSAYKRVGASWLTKENTLIDTENVLNYIDAILAQEAIPKNCNFIVLGYSQGVSVAARWLGKRKRVCNQLIMISGMFPTELTKTDFEHLPNLQTIHTVGENDPLFERKNVLLQEERVQTIFNGLKLINHNKGHELESNLFTKYLGIST